MQADAANAKYVTLDKNTGALTLTNKGKQLKAVVSIIVNIVAESRWGTITNYAAGNAVTVKIDPTIKIQVFFHLKTHHTNKTENEDVFIEKAIKVDL